MLNFCLWTTDKIFIVMKKFFLTAALMLGIGSISFAQDINFGVRAGLGLGHQMGDLDDTKVKVGVTLGGIADFNFTESFALQTGLYYTNKGYTMKEGKLKNIVSVNCFEIPVLASYRKDINERMQIQANVGPYMSIGLAGRDIYKYEDNKESESVYGDDGYMKRFDLGLSFGAGLLIDQIYAGVKYDLGLLNTVDSDHIKSKLGVFYFSVGYNF